MENYSFRISENNFLKYFSKNDRMYFIPNKTDLNEFIENAYVYKDSPYKHLDKHTEKVLRRSYFDEIISGKDKDLTKFFINNYLESKASIINSIFALLCIPLGIS